MIEKMMKLYRVKPKITSCPHHRCNKYGCDGCSKKTVYPEFTGGKAWDLLITLKNNQNIKAICIYGDFIGATGNTFYEAGYVDNQKDAFSQLAYLMYKLHYHLTDEQRAKVKTILER